MEYKRSKGGFPIRRSSDQSSFAAPQGLSQRTTSFIASQRQGIHQMLLRHLIVLMIDVRFNSARRHRQKKDQLQRVMRQSFCLPNPSGQPACGPASNKEHDAPLDRMNSLFTMSNIRASQHDQHEAPRPPEQSSTKPLPRKPSQRKRWWSQTGSNRRPPECKSGALPAELWPLDV